MFDKKCKKIDNVAAPETPRFKTLFHFSKKAEVTQRKFREKRCSYIKERTTQKEHLTSQSIHLDTLLKNNSINQDTYARLKKLLEMKYEEKINEIRERHGFPKTNHN